MTKTLDDLKREYTTWEKEQYDSGWNDCIDHLHAQGRILPDGYVAVPLEPTDEHMQRIFEAWMNSESDFKLKYKNIIAAAQKGDGE